MNVGKIACLSLGLLMLASGTCWAGDAGGVSAHGTASLGAAGLSAISAPLLVTSGTVTGDSQMAGIGLSEAAWVPGMAIIGTGEIATGTAIAVCETGKAIVHLVNAAGEKLTEFNEQVFDDLNLGPSVGNVPTVQAQINHQTKRVPLVVRQQYVQMNEPDK